MQGTRAPYRATDSRHNTRVERFWGEVNVHIIRPAKRYVEWVEEQLLDGEHLWTTGEEYDAEALGSIHRVLLPALELACDLMVRARGLHCLIALIGLPGHLVQYGRPGGSGRDP